MYTKNYVKTGNSKKNLLVVFSGHVHTKEENAEIIREGLFEDRFNFTKTIIQNTTADCLWIKDKKNEFYINGVEGVGENVQEVSKFIENQMNGYEKSIFMGSCAASFPATLYGSILNVHAVISYLTLINLSLTEYHQQQFKYSKNLCANNPDVYEKYKNLKLFLNKTTKYYCQPPKKEDELHTKKHYDEIKHLPNVYKLDCPDVPYLIKMNTFELLLNEIFNGDTINFKKYARLH